MHPTVPVIFEESPILAEIEGQSGTFYKGYQSQCWCLNTFKGEIKGECICSENECFKHFVILQRIRLAVWTCLCAKLLPWCIPTSLITEIEEMLNVFKVSWMKSCRWPAYCHAETDVIWKKGISAGTIAPEEEKSLRRLPVCLCFQLETKDRKAVHLQGAQAVVGHWLAAETDGVVFPVKSCRLPTASAPRGALDHIRYTLITCQKAVPSLPQPQPHLGPMQHENYFSISTVAYFRS